MLRFYLETLGKSFYIHYTLCVSDISVTYRFSPPPLPPPSHPKPVAATGIKNLINYMYMGHH